MFHCTDIGSIAGYIKGNSSLWHLQR